MRDPLFYLKERVHNWYRKLGIQWIAAELGKKPETLSKEVSEWSNNKHEIWTLIEAMEISRDLKPLELLNEHFRCLVITMHPSKESEESIVRGMSECLISLGKVGEDLRFAIDPDSPGGTLITRDEWNKLVHSAYEHARQLLNFVYSLSKVSSQPTNGVIHETNHK